LSEREHELARVHHPRCGAAAWSMTTNLKTAKSTRRDAGVIVAEVNLKLIWDVISQIKVGERGQAYLVDAQGRLIAPS
jgi:hypothetical protein